MSRDARRRGFMSWLVEPYKQVKLGLMFLLVNSVFAVLILGVFGYYLMEMYGAVTSYFKFSDQESMLTFTKFSWPFFVGGSLILAFIGTTLFVSIKYTHQIYGPLVSIHRYLDDLLAGVAPTPLQLRESDQLKDLAAKLNQLSDTLTHERAAQARILGPLVSINRYVEDLDAGTTPSPLQLRETDELKELAGKLNALGAKLARSKGSAT